MEIANLLFMSMGITSNIAGASQDVLHAIKNASVKTGVDFDYLVNQARTESSFRPDVKAKTSSATGLYQFIDQTWLQTVSKHGAKHGLGDEVKSIKQDFQGRFFVSDDTQKQVIMNLRKDPHIASLMAAEFASDNQKHIEQKTGRDANSTDLYLSHFLGAGGATKFLKAMQSDPRQPAADILPSAAKANKNIFYKTDGSLKSLSQIYNHFEAKIGEVSEGQLAQNDQVDINASRENVMHSGYQRDIQFERMYGQKVNNFIMALPQMDALSSSEFFSDFYGSDVSKVMRNSSINQSLFLALTMLDFPK